MPDFALPFEGKLDPGEGSVRRVADELVPQGASRLRDCLRFLFNALDRNLRFMDDYAKKPYKLD